MPDNATVSRPVKSGDHVFLVDGSSYIFRAYHALPPLTRPSDGLPVGAIAGFCNMLWRLLKDADAAGAGVRPTHIAVVFDKSEHTFRNELYTEYKAHRPDAPDDLIPQFGLIRDAVRAFNIASVEQLGFEADDLIATYTRLAREAGADVTIVASDKDLMQLVGLGVVMLDTMKQKTIGPAEVMERFGVPPEKVIDVQALCGDSVDNIPGVPGIGVKTAAQLINEYGDLETLLARAVDIKQPKRREALIAHAEDARLSKRLVTLDRDVALETPIDALVVRPVDGERLIAYCRALELASLARRVGDATGVDPASVEPQVLEIRGWHDAGVPRNIAPRAAEESWERKRTSDDGPHIPPLPAALAAEPAAAAAARAKAANAVPVDPARYETVHSLDALGRWIDEAMEVGQAAIDVRTNTDDPMRAEICGFTLATRPGRAAYVPLGHLDGEGDGDLLGGGRARDQIDPEVAIERLRPLLENRSVIKIGQNLKSDYVVLARRGLSLAPYDDIMLMAYVLDAGRAGTGIAELSQHWLGHAPIAFADVAGSGKSRVRFDRIAIDTATAYSGENADLALRLWTVLKPRLVAEHMTTVYETLERPMIPVLARMEETGIRIDRQVLSRMSGEFAQTLARLEHDIAELAGETFNIGSPKQLGDILFGKFGLPGGKKTKTGAWSTGADVLEELAAQGHALPARILEWRQISKLKTTYTDALPGYIHPETGRVHTSYALASTTTGRLSSSEPNLQNIPIRTEEGRRIRTAFVAEKGHKLISADYSQIELRVLAHMAEIPQLREAFANGVDIHAMTASEMFGVPVKGMPSETRRRAKAINFGIIYGISAFGLANQLGIGRQEAGDYIKRYFERFPGIRDYIEATKEFCRRNGYVQTLFGRKAHYPLIQSKNPAERSFNERAAINAPIQGTAADVIRRAMVRMPAALESAGLGTRMLLQVHDELVFEAPDGEADAAMGVVGPVMERAAEPAIHLSVPLVVETRAGDNWEAAH
jgi:DNA polymerase-1